MGSPYDGPRYRVSAVPIALEELQERLERIESTVESTALEVERMLEANQFIAKLIADRGEAPKLPARAPPAQGSTYGIVARGRVPFHGRRYAVPFHTCANVRLIAAISSDVY